MQDWQPKAEEDPRAILMESWPEDPHSEGGVMATVGPVLKPCTFPHASWLVRAGDPAACIFFIKGGSVEIVRAPLPQVCDDAVSSPTLPFYSSPSWVGSAACLSRQPPHPICPFIHQNGSVARKFCCP